MQDNPYNRKEYIPSNVNYMVVVSTNGGPYLATRSAFASYDDAKKYADTMASCYYPKIFKTADPDND